VRHAAACANIPETKKRQKQKKKRRKNPISPFSGRTEAQTVKKPQLATDEHG
jgi:hypothetical protein